MTGHALPQVAEAIARQAERGITTMLPTADATWVARRARPAVPAPVVADGDDGDRRQPLRAALRPPPHRASEDLRVRLVLPRHGRRDARRSLDATGDVVARPGSIGPQVDPALTTRVVPFNDLDALEAALAHGDVAAVLMEPALTNIGIVLPDPGYHDARARAHPPVRRVARSSTRRTRSVPVPAAAPRRGSSTPTSSSSASRSPAGCRPRRTG